MSMFSTQSSYGAPSRDRRLERVEVHRHQVDRRDVVLAHLLQVFRLVAAAEDAAMDLRHQGLHAAVQDLGKAGMLGDFLDRHARLAQGAGRSAGGQDFHAARRQGLANGTRPDLSETEINARRMGTMSVMAAALGRFGTG